MIAVAGATGYIGGLLCRRLAEGGQEVRALARDPKRAEELKAKAAEEEKARITELNRLADLGRRHLKNCRKDHQ